MSRGLDDRWPPNRLRLVAMGAKAFGERRLLKALISLIALSLVWGSSPSAHAQAMSPRQTQRLLKNAATAMKSARALLARKKTKLAGRRLTEAAKDFQAILKADAGQRDALVGLSQVYYLTRDYTAGVKLMRPAVAAKPTDLDLAHQLGLHLYRDGQRPEAVKQLERVAKDPKRFDAMWLLSTHYYRSAEWSKGLAHLQRYVSVRPKDIKALGLLGTFYLKLERYKEAIANFDRFLAKYKDNVSARVNRANALFRSEDYDKAAAAYTALLKEMPKRSRLIYNLAAIHIRQGRCELAIPELERFLVLQKNHATGLYFKADCQFKLKRYAQAKQSFLAAGQAASNNPWVPYGLSRIAHIEGDNAEALRYAKKASKIGPSEWEIAGWVGTLLRRDGQPAEALVWHERALKTKPDAAPLHVERGRDLWALKRLGDAVEAFSKGLALEPELVTAKVGLVTSQTALGVQARAAGEPERARRYLQDAIKTMPGYDLARVNLALMELEAQNTAAAAASIAGVSGGGAEVSAVRGMVRLLEGKLGEAQKAIEVALAAGPTMRLRGLALTASGHLAARAGRWGEAVSQMDAALKLEPTDALRRARALSALSWGLEQLGRGEGAKARTILSAVAKDRTLLSDRGDRLRLDVGLAAAAVVASPTNEGASNRLSKMVSGRKLKGKSWAQVRDIGNAYAAYSLLRRKRFDACLKQLKKVADPLGGVVKRMSMAAVDAKARKAFERNKHKQAIALWRTIEEPTGAMKVNLGAAMFASGDVSGAALWRSANSSEALYNQAVAADREGRYKDAFGLFKRYLKRGGTMTKRASQRVRAKKRVFGWK